MTLGTLWRKKSLDDLLKIDEVSTVEYTIAFILGKNQWFGVVCIFVLALDCDLTVILKFDASQDSNQ